MIVIDSNIFAKQFIDEHDSEQAKAFFKYCIENKTPLFAPTLFTYEVLQITVYYHHPIEDALQRIESYLAFNLTLEELQKSDWLQVEKMIASGHKKSGYPSLYDSSYHILAKSKGCIFLTADKRHKAKTEKAGNITLLKDWAELFQ